ncbi:S9 family peptidase [Sphingobium aquiterrae]|uniref:S9 family peptidase n=1 Tax=Sphingobium aquiterrae TaxID=2038656 RepID=UPI00301ACCA8
MRMTVAVLLGLIAAPAMADVTAVQIERSVHLREDWQYLTRDVADPATFTSEGKLLYRKTVEGGFAFVVYDPATGARAPAIDQARVAAALGKATNEKIAPLRLPFQRFDFADGGKAIQFQMDEVQWRCTLTDYMCGKAPRRRQARGFGVVRDLDIPADNHPRRSPDGKWEAHVENFNIAVRPIGGMWKRISSDGSDGNFYDPESIAWSPDSQKLAAYRVRPGFHRIVYKVRSSPADQVQPELTTQLYPKPGDAVDIDTPVLFHVAEARALPIAAGLFDNPYDMSALAWSKDSATLSFVYEQRGHQLARIVQVDAQTGVPHAAVTEAARTFVNEGRRFRHDLDNGRGIIWMSERDGWNHLYLFDGRSGKVTRQITRGPWVVRDVLKVDEGKRQIYFTASGMRAGEDPYFQHFYRVDFDGSHLTALTTVDAYHDVALSPDMATYVDTYSRVDLPPVSELHRSSDGALIATIEKGDISRLLAAGFKAPEPFIAKGRDGKTDIYGLIVRPRDFDPVKTYPVIENIYAGPHSSFVPKTWWPFGYHGGGDKVIGMQSLADLGFIVVQIDGMGTLNRSKAFHDVAWKNIADAGFPDRILWHKAAAAKYPWYDIGKVGIYGGSAGGQDTLLGLLFHPEFYKVGVAFAGCYDNRMDKISWNEQWMGWPVDASYSASSGVDNAWRLQGKLLMIVGELDSNVDPSSTFQVADALIKAGKVFDLLVVPGEGHAAGRSTGPIDYGQRKQFDFFLHNLAGQETPNWNEKPVAPPAF